MSFADNLINFITGQSSIIFLGQWKLLCM